MCELRQQEKFPEEGCQFPLGGDVSTRGCPWGVSPAGDIQAGPWEPWRRGEWKRGRSLPEREPCGGGGMGRGQGSKASDGG